MPIKNPIAKPRSMKRTKWLLAPNPIILNGYALDWSCDGFHSNVYGRRYKPPILHWVGTSGNCYYSYCNTCFNRLMRDE